MRILGYVRFFSTAEVRFLVYDSFKILFILIITGEFGGFYLVFVSTN